MSNLSRFLIRTSAFIRKEIFEILRQPMLVLTLILGPFLILLFFGIGYRNEARALRTVFVVNADDGLAQTIEQNASSLGTQLVFAGITNDLEDAKARLRRGEVDLITVVPADAYNTIRSNEQAVFQLYHQEIDPFQIDYINVFGRVYIDEVNRRVLRFVTTEGQGGASEAKIKLVTAQESAAALRDLLERCATALASPAGKEECDSAGAQAYVQDLDRSVDDVQTAVGDSMRLSDAIEQGLNSDRTTDTNDSSRPDLATIIQETNELAELGETVDDYIASLEILAKLETDLADLEVALTEFQDLNPGVLISPFRAEAISIAEVVPQPSEYFAPSVVALLLQHLAITFAALSMVREHQLGTMELFFVAPLSAIEILLGKYLSYLIFAVVLAALLLILIVLGMGVPMLGNWLNIGLVVLALVFTSLGIGFVISLISKTDIQAVQYSMIVLLTSVFFSGFILTLEALWEPVRVISWTLPATYGILLLRGIMLRGDPLTLTLWGQLTLIGAGLFLLAWWLLYRAMTRA